MNRIHFSVFLTLLIFLTLSLTVAAQVVDIPDPSLRAAVESALGKASSDPITADEMATLTALDSNWIGPISDLTGLEGATNLTRLDLEGNSISDISPLVSNTGLGSGDSVYVRGNPLSIASVQTHIPALKSRGVRVDFDPIALSYDLNGDGTINILDLVAVAGQFSE